MITWDVKYLRALSNQVQYNKLSIHLMMQLVIIAWNSSETGHRVALTNVWAYKTPIKLRDIREWEIEHESKCS